MFPAQLRSNTLPIALGALFLALSGAVACGGDSNDQAIAAATLSEGCLLNSDCSGDLICAFRRCHVECNTTRDCRDSSASAELRCVLSEKPTRVCQLEDEVTCSYNSECPGSQICAGDGECRDACVATSDCVSEQICTAGVCAGTDELDENGFLPNSSGGPAEVTCRYSSDCPAPEACRDGICEAECKGNRDCQTGFRCDAEVCVPDGGGGSGGAGGAGGAGAGGAGGSGATSSGGSSAGGSGASGGSAGSGSGGAPNLGSCSNGVQDGAEVDIDCSGPSCFPCTVTQGCDAATDCTSGVCTLFECAAPACDDGVRNGSEQGTDCGGDCAACTGTTSCTLDAECAPGSCQGGQCRPVSCSDGVKNGSETSVDCGGPDCGPCDPGQVCATAGDCDSERCLVGRCADPTCSDGITNGDEVGTDCGGSCQLCPAGSPCGAPGDCSSRVCDGNVCALPTCSDTVANGSETDQDCGGPTCPKCGESKLCSDASDCLTSSCSAGTCDVVPGCTPQNPALEVPNCGGTVTTESEPNDLVAQATPICVGQTVSAVNDNDNDVDYFVFDTPNVPYGGYVVVTGGSTIGAAKPLFKLTNETTQTIIEEFQASNAGVGALWFAVAGGERFYVKHVHGLISATGYDYELTAEWYPTFDCFEPNDVRADAKRILVGSPISALSQTGWKAGEIGQTPLDTRSDWYVVSLVDGPVNLTVSSPASTARPEITLYNATGILLENEHALNMGSGVSLDYTLTAAADYWVLVSGRTGSGTDTTRNGEGSTPKPHYTDPYTLTVTQ